MGFFTPESEGAENTNHIFVRCEHIYIYIYKLHILTTHKRHIWMPPRLVRGNLCHEINK